MPAAFLQVARMLRFVRLVRSGGQPLGTFIPRLAALFAVGLVGIPLMFAVGVIAAIGKNQEAVAKACAGRASSAPISLPLGIAFKGQGGTFLATAYGPPWNRMQGYGTTATGIHLPGRPTGIPGPYIIAVDPEVIPLHSRVYVWPNPFDYRGLWQAEDTGGAIDRNRIDFLDMLGRAHQLAWGARTVTVSAEPPSGAGMMLGDTVSLAPGDDIECDAAHAAGGPLPLTPGERAELRPDGLAAAPEQAPEIVKRVIAWGNEIVGKPYLYGGGHERPLSAIAPKYDCSASVGHALYGGGLVGPTPETSGSLAVSFGVAGYGKWISVLANDDHVYMYVAGLRWDTHLYGAADRGNPGIGWHTARRPDVGFTARHPSQL